MSTETVRAVLFDVAPEFDTVDTAELARVDRFIGYAQLEVSDEAWGSKTDLVQALLAAHMLTLSARKGSNQGAVVKERVGDLERGYAPPNGNEADPYSATSYGVEFKRITSKAGGGSFTPFVV